MFHTITTCVIVLLMLTSAHQGHAQNNIKKESSVKPGILSFTMKTSEGKNKALADYKGTVLLIVNTASKCGYTKQYASLEALNLKYRDKGLRILAFPANNFGAQEPGNDDEIRAFCSTTYNVTFDLFSKISVKGPDMHPFYAVLTKDPVFGGAITWNFNKFLVDRRGAVAARFDTRVDPMSDDFTAKVEELLTAK